MRLTLLTIYSLLCILGRSQNDLDSLIESFEEVKYSDLTKSSQIVDEIRKFKRFNSPIDRVKAFKTISDFYVVSGQFTTALQYSDSALQIAEQYDIPQSSEFILDAGIVNSYAGANNDAIQLYHEALSIAKLEGSLHQAKVYLALGEIWRKTGNYDLSWNYLDSAYMQVDSSKESAEILARIYNRKAAVKNELGELDASMRLSKLALDYAISSQNRDLMATSYNELGFSEWHIDNRKGIPKVLKAANLWAQIGKKRYEVSALLNATKFYLQSGNTDSAKILLVRCEDIVSINPWYGIRSEIFLYKEMIANSEGNMVEAHKYLGEYYRNKMAYENAVRNENIQKIQYEFKLKEVDAELTSKDKLLSIERKALRSQEQTNNKLKNSRTLILVLFIITALLLIVVFLSRRKVVEQSKKLMSTNDQLEESLENQSYLLKEVHHRVKNNLQVITSLLEMQSNAQEDDQVKQVLLESKGRIASMNLIHSKLYQQEDLAYVQMDEYILNLHREIAMLYKPEVLPRIEIDVNSVLVNTKTAVHIGIMLNELITNTYKYGIGGPDSVLKINVRKLKGSLSLQYEDNGPGFDYALFKTPQSNSIGLRIVKNMLRQMNAKYELDTSGKLLLKMEIKVRENDSDN